MPTEADTCRTLITPKLQAAGWEDDPHSIAEQRTFTDGRIIVHGSRARRRAGKRADYILRYTRDFPIAVVEAKSEDEPAATGLQQTKDYAEILKFKFAYATNGDEIAPALDEYLRFGRAREEFAQALINQQFDAVLVQTVMTYW